MKKSIAISLFLFAAICNGQTYHHLVDTSKRWNFYDCYPFGPPPHYSTFYRFAPDTIINAYTYNELESTGDSVNWYRTQCFFREEDSTQRVYMLYNNVEGLMYDFSLNMGDSALVFNPGCIQCVPQMLRVDSVDSMMVGSHFRKIIYAEDTSQLSFSINVWIEGIGSDKGPQYSGMPLVVGWCQDLVCYHEGDSLMYLNPNYGYCYKVLVDVPENLLEEQVSIAALGAGRFVISSPAIIDNLILYNVVGRKLQEYAPASGTYMLDLSQHPGGIYLVKCQMKDRSQVKKVFNGFH